MTRELCKICYHPNPVGFTVPGEIWEEVVPEKFRTEIVCLSCFIRLADEKLITWDKTIEFWSVSLATMK
jgi:hypothetical protein